MKLTMQLTLDGLVRALRLDAHGLAEEIEGGYRLARDRDEFAMGKRQRMAKGEKDDDSARR